MTSLTAATARLLDRLRPDSIPASMDVDLVAAPSTAEEAAEVLTAAAADGLRTTFVGRGTVQSIGGPRPADLVLSSARMSDVIDWQPEDLTIVIGSGMRVADLQAVLAGRRQTAVLPEQPGEATIGGVVATARSGYRRLRYGPTRDRILEVTLATGYGKVVRAGGRVVKNVTGYDLPRLVTGSLGSLGFIGSVCLKLWPAPLFTATVRVPEAAAALAAAYRPLAVIESDGGSAVYLAGTAAEVEAQADALGGDFEEGLAWPAPLLQPNRLALRLPARFVGDGVTVSRSLLGDVGYRAEHGLGTVTVGSPVVDHGAWQELRTWAERCGGSLVVTDGPAEAFAGFDPWGRPPASIEIQRRIKEAFDPAGICNPGILPGGL